MAASRPLVAIAGNPNAGKTTLWNALTGGLAKVGNYPGITVEKRTGTLQLAGQAVDLLDIPGTYSLSARSHDEQIAVSALLGLDNNPRPDVVIICVDAGQLARGSYLVVQALELGLNTIVALTMSDELPDVAPDPKKVAEVLGSPCVALAVKQGKGVAELKAEIARSLKAPRTLDHWVWQPSEALAASMAKVSQAFPSEWPQKKALSLWALTCVDEQDELANIPEGVRKVVNQETRNFSGGGKSIDDELIGKRYAWLDSNIAPLLRGKPKRPLTQTLDRVALNRWLGFPVFAVLMFLLFQALFSWAEPGVEFVDMLIGLLKQGVAQVLPAGLVRDFINDGVIAGVGSVITFLPQILLLFFFLGLMEDSGYMARVAYLMDRVMRTMNLHGRAFVPMLSGFACAVPAVLATRTMERKRDRLLTMMVVPLMTCSARLPVYTLVIAALFPSGSFAGFSISGWAMAGMYGFSVLCALIAAWVLSKLVKPLRGIRLPLVLELPPYRWPRPKDVVRMMFERSMHFLREAGGIILICSIILWGLLSFPKHSQHNPDAAVDAADQIANSYGGRLGHAIEPVIAPLGFDWKIGVGIVGAFAAREVFVSTMGVIYSAGSDADEFNESLRGNFAGEKKPDGTRKYTPLVGLSLMVFFALACQCISTLAVVKRETHSWGWPLFLFGYMTVLAWVASFAVYQIGRLLGFA